ncbi:RNA 2',3'-cyclic phosphodiesterase [Pontibacter sp. E15-1]|uniref:RNA 2',3'-cyclic phosphodiesterase n=1 Tax=Pontibacter sp. E15-1 TaxID=2919918 RepID=UPI001F4F8732|nr:RNA 2',3'-cyclic phosphodiesterase [Pontibacter sp. E15-1]MCJ8165371.1 RNA 2',3'-cyclic phosphodiesterase [Pontibacter sp. E15-1]
MQDSIRLFVAALLPEALKTQLEEQLAPFRHPSVRFVPSSNLHLTLYFIGNVPVQQLSAFQEKIQEVAARHAPFTLNYACTEPGPNQRRPRLVWARFEAHEAFSALSDELTTALATHPPKRRKAIPHVTLARFRKDVPLPEVLPIVRAEAPLALGVQEVALWQSELASPHPVYSVLKTFRLG